MQVPEETEQTAQLTSEQVKLSSNIANYSFEDQKENIISIKQGRSGAALSQMFSVTPSKRHEQLQEGHNKFSQELQNLEELDDPLDVYSRYIEWTIQNYPEGHNHESNLIQLLEAATRSFQDDVRYHNDARYLKYWIQYSKYVEQPREIFVFLENKNIGSNYAVYYEEYGTLLEGSQKYKEADEIYKLGIRRYAQPLERLNRRYNDFQIRMMTATSIPDENAQTASEELGNPLRKILGIKGSASATKSAPLNVTLAKTSTGSREATNILRLEPVIPIDESLPGTSKFPVFYDPDGRKGAAALAASENKWKDYGTDASRKKENIHDPLKWKGETLPQKSNCSIIPAEKLEIYHDEPQRSSLNETKRPIEDLKKLPENKSDSSKEHKPTRETNSSHTLAKHSSSSQTRKAKSSHAQLPEKLFINLGQFYVGDEEFCFEEIRAKKYLGWDDKNIEKEEHSIDEKTSECYTDVKTNPTSNTSQGTPIKDATTDESEKTNRPSPTINTKEALADIYEIFSQPLIHEHSDDENGDYGSSSRTKRENKPKIFFDENSLLRTPTSSYNTSGIFAGQKRKESHDENFDLFENSFNSQTSAKRQALGILFPLDCVHKETDLENSQSLDDELDNKLCEGQNSLTLRNQYSNNRGDIRTVPFEILTPIDERNSEYESGKASLSSIASLRITESNESTGEINDTFGHKTPKQVIPLSSKSEQPILHFQAFNSLPGNLCNPMDPEIRNNFFSELNPPLSSYNGFYDHKSLEFNGSEKVNNCATNWINNSRRRNSTMIDSDYTLNLLGDAFEIRQKLGEGGFAKVYCMIDKKSLNKPIGNEIHQSSNCNNKPAFRALKLQRPPDAWEFYILHQLHKRVSAATINSFISAYSLYLFKDESYMVMEYLEHGTIIDVVNTVTKENTTMDELLVGFFTVELLKAIEAMHTAGIMHGDLKADNLLVRLEPTEEWNSQYSPTGSNGWSKKGVKVIDFGRAIDLTLFSEETKFICDWETNEQDCYEMRVGKPWKWHADYYGLAGIIYCMLHHKFIQTTCIDENFSRKRYMPLLPFKRYWQDLWRRMFDMLLNPSYVRLDGQLPITNELRDVRRELEGYLVMNCERNGKSLKSMLRKLEKREYS
ncbi:9138_t:CDS:2 [Ambispora gerdemannii]|uniref:9138_t:CDS:1 n=1 Tax=Ambispora gerdemannii TaxID=144530 RepID=A0A9N8V0P8_9GLOM|nr:9138_t:CDS:2 [Ambispora gerdemannii]